MRRLGINVIFAVALFAAWAWYHVAVPSPGKSYRFNFQTNLVGWQFDPVPVPETTREILASTNIFNGIYRGPNGRRVTVFIGEWTANKARELNVVGHTPDVCWVAGGWKPIKTERLRSTLFKVSDESIPFEVREFQPPIGSGNEITIWCTVVNGQFYQEKNPFKSMDLLGGDGSLASDKTARRVSASHFWNSILQRVEATGDKQFIRISMETKGDRPSDLAALGDFVGQWLRITQQ
jgi:hypothetical protein